MRVRFTAGLLTLTVGAGLLALGAPGAHAGSKGRRNTAIGLGAVAAYSLLKGKTGTGLAAGAGAAYAYKRYRDARKQEQRSDRYDRYTRDDGSYYRTRSTNDRFQFPAGYGGSDDGYQYQNDGSQYRRTRERQTSRPYVTDERGNRRYYDPQQGDGYRRYDGRRYRGKGVQSRYEVDTQASQYRR